MIDRVFRAFAWLWCLYCLVWWLAWLVLPVWANHTFEYGVLPTVGAWVFFWCFGSAITLLFLWPVANYLTRGSDHG